MNCSNFPVDWSDAWFIQREVKNITCCERTFIANTSNLKQHGHIIVSRTQYGSTLDQPDKGNNLKTSKNPACVSSIYITTFSTSKHVLLIILYHGYKISKLAITLMVDDLNGVI